MNRKLQLHMTASELAMGRFMRAPDHPNGGEGGGAAVSEPEAAAEPAEQPGQPVSAETDDFAAFERQESFGEVDSPAPGADTDEGAEAPEEVTEEGQQPSEEKKGKSAQERIDEVTATAREAERLAAERERMLNDPAELQRRLDALNGGAKNEEGGEPSELLEGEPDPKDYQYGELDKEFIKDSAAFHARAEFQRQEAVRNLTTEFENIDAAYEERAEKAVERYPDFEEKVVKSAQGPNPTWKSTPVMALAMKTSEVGPDVAYYLASNPAESERIAGLSPLEQAREMGRLDGRFMYQEKPPVKKVSSAPPPPSQVNRGGGGKFKPAADTDDFTAFDKGYRSEASGG